MTTERMPFEQQSTSVSSTAAVAASAVSTLTALLTGSPAGTALTVCGLLGVVLGLRRSRDRLVDAGTLALVAGVVIATAVGSAPIVAALGAAAAIVARAAATDAVVRGRQLGKAASGRVEGRRVARTAGFVCVAAVGAASLTTRTISKLPTVALVALLLGSVLIVIAVRN